MKQLTQKQIFELKEIADHEAEGKVVNLACFGASGRLDTRANRIEHVLPNVHSLVVLGGNGMFSQLSEQEKTDCVMKIFNHFWKEHLNFSNDRFEFVGLQDDFFTNETYNKLLDYANIFFANRIDDEIAGRNQYKYKLSTKSEVKMLKQMDAAFPKSLYRKMKEVSKNYLRRKREQENKDAEISLLQQLVANNLAWKDARVSGETKRELILSLTI